MKNWLKKVLSLLTAIALLIFAGALAFAEEDAEPIEPAASDAVQQADEDAAAQQDAGEADAQQGTDDAAPQQDTDDAAAQQAAAEAEAKKAAEEAAAKKAAEEAAAQQADPIPSYNNEETPAEGQDISNEEEEYDPNDPTIIFIDDDDHGHTDPVTVDELDLVMTDEKKFPNAVRMNLNETVSGTVDAENKAEFLFTTEFSLAAVLDLTASSEDVNVEINDETVRFEKAEGTENGAGLNATANKVLPEGTYYIVLTSSSPVSYSLTIKDAYAAKVNADEENKEESNTANSGENTEENSENSNNDSEAEGINDNDGENNTNPETTEEEFPVIKGWVSVNAETFEIGDVITLKAESDTELGDMVLWQTKVQNEEGEITWQNLGYGATLEVELTEENIASTYRFKMEYDNYSDEFTLNAKEEQTEETEQTEEDKQPDETAETEETEVIDEETRKMTELGYTKVIVTAEEGADLYAEESKESEVLGHLDANTEAWVLLNEDQTWCKLYSEDEEAAGQYIFMEDAEIVLLEEATDVTKETNEETKAEKMVTLGYTKIIVTAEDGADLYAEEDKESEILGHLDVNEKIWVLLNEEQTWGKLYNEMSKSEESAETESTKDAEEKAAQYIFMEDAKIANVENEYEVVSIKIDLPLLLKDREVTYFGDETTVNADITGLEGYDNISFQWFYSEDGGRNWTEVEGANGTSYNYILSFDNWEYRWKVEATYYTKVEMDTEESEKNE